MLHIAATTQIRNDTAGRAYYRRKIAAGKTPMEAMRCLKRRISDAVYRQLIADAQAADIATGEPSDSDDAFEIIWRPASDNPEFETWRPQVSSP